MRLVFLLMLLYNAALFAYFFTRGQDRLESAVAQQTNVEGAKRLVLVSENQLPATLPAATAVSVANKVKSKVKAFPDNKAESVAKEKVTALPASSATAIATQAVAACYAVGPFADQVVAQNILAQGTSSGLVGVLRLDESLLKKFSVYIPPLPTKQDVLAAAKKLREAQIDHFVIAKGPRTNGIAVGLFPSRDEAGAQQQKVQGFGFAVNIEERTTKANQYWLDIPGGEAWRALLDKSAPDMPRVERPCVP